jgi:hypothetical protein
MVSRSRRKVNNAMVIQADGMVYNFERKPTLEDLQRLVSGYITTIQVWLPGNDIGQLVVNEEGLPLGLPHNLNATQLAGQRIVGDAVLLRGQWRLS